MRVICICLLLLTGFQIPCVMAQEHRTVRLDTRSWGPADGQAIAFSPDSRELTIGTESKTYFIDVATANLTGTDPARSFEIAYSTDGTVLHLIARNAFSWLNARSKQKMILRASSTPGFIGITLQRMNGKILITRVEPGSPTDESGKIHVGDELVSIGQGNNSSMISVIGQSPNRAIDMIKGNAGTKLRLGIIPKGGIKELEHSLVRASNNMAKQRQSENGGLGQQERTACSYTSRGKHYQFSNAKNGVLLSNIQLQNIVTPASISEVSPDGRYCAFVGQYVNPPKRQSVRATWMKSSSEGGSDASQVSGAAGDRLGFGASDSSPMYGAEIFEITTGKLISSFSVAVGNVPYNHLYIEDVSFSPDNESIVVCNWSEINRYQVKTGDWSRSYSTGLQGGDGAKTVDITGNILAIGDVGGGVSLVSLDKGKLIKRFESREKSPVHVTAISLDGNHLAFYSKGVAHLVRLDKYTDTSKSTDTRLPNDADSVSQVAGAKVTPSK